MDSRADYVRMRWVSDSLGTVYPAQMVSFVTIVTALIGKTQVKFDNQNKRVIVVAKRHVSGDDCVKMSKSTKSIFGDSWFVEVEEDLSLWQKIKRWVSGRQN